MSQVFIQKITNNNTLYSTYTLLLVEIQMDSAKSSRLHTNLMETI